MSLLIRPAVAADAGEVAALRLAAAEDLTTRFGNGHWSSSTSKKGVLAAMTHGRVFLAERGGGIVGTLTLSTKKPWAIDARHFTRVKTPIYLTSMAISPAAQGQGVGRAMMAEAEHLARSWKPDRGEAIRLDAFNAPAGAGAFYAKCGYQERGRVVFRTVPLIYFERLVAAH